MHYRGIDSLLLSSENPQRLADFYKEKVGLELTTEAEMGENGEVPLFGFEFEGGGTGLWITSHSEVHGESKEPQRIMFNLETKGVIEDHIERLDKEGVKKIGGLHHVEGYGKICTFEDPDGNYFQLVQVREEG